MLIAVLEFWTITKASRPKCEQPALSSMFLSTSVLIRLFITLTAIYHIVNKNILLVNQKYQFVPL